MKVTQGAVGQDVKTGVQGPPNQATAFMLHNTQGYYEHIRPVMDGVIFRVVFVDTFTFSKAKLKHAREREDSSDLMTL